MIASRAASTRRGCDGGGDARRRTGDSSPCPPVFERGHQGRRARSPRTWLRFHGALHRETMSAYDAMLAGAFAAASRTSPRRTCRRDRGNVGMAPPTSSAVGSPPATSPRLRWATHALRRYGRGLCRAQGRVQGLGVPPRALAQRERSRDWCRAACSTAALGELRAEQTDQDSLPPYDVLDAILQGTRGGQRRRELCGAAAKERWRGHPHGRPLEYKRRQAPPGIKISTKAFGRDRACRSLTATRAAPTTLPRTPAAGLRSSALGAATAIVTRERAQTRPSSR